MLLLFIDVLGPTEKILMKDNHPRAFDSAIINAQNTREIEMQSQGGFAGYNMSFVQTYCK